MVPTEPGAILYDRFRGYVVRVISVRDLEPEPDDPADATPGRAVKVCRAEGSRVRLVGDPGDVYEIDPCFLQPCRPTPPGGGTYRFRE